MVFGLAKGLGLLTTNEITDVALAEGWRRFLPIVRLLPFVALATALLVTGGVYGIAQLAPANGRSGGTSWSGASKTPLISRRGDDGPTPGGMDDGGPEPDGM